MRLLASSIYAAFYNVWRGDKHFDHTQLKSSELNKKGEWGYTEALQAKC